MFALPSPVLKWSFVSCAVPVACNIMVHIKFQMLGFVTRRKFPKERTSSLHTLSHVLEIRKTNQNKTKQT